MQLWSTRLSMYDRMNKSTNLIKYMIISHRADVDQAQKSPKRVARNQIGDIKQVQKGINGC